MIPKLNLKDKGQMSSPFYSLKLYFKETSKAFISLSLTSKTLYYLFTYVMRMYSLLVRAIGFAKTIGERALS